MRAFETQQEFRRTNMLRRSNNVSFDPIRPCVSKVTESNLLTAI